MTGIEFKDITKRYGSLAALDRVCLHLEPEKIYGLLGRNGAGKTTLLNILTGRIFADQGAVTIDGEAGPDNDAALRKIYMMSDMTCYPEGMRLREVLRWTQTFYPNFAMDFAMDLLEKFRVNLSLKVKALSTGYNSIFKLILALASGAPYIVLDEPVLGLDANHRELFYKVLLERYMAHPSTIILSTHLVEEVSGLIEEVIIIKEGRILLQEPCEDLLARGYTASGPAELVDRYCQGKALIGESRLGGLKSAYILGQAGEAPQNIEITRLDLQKLFIQLTRDEKEA